MRDTADALQKRKYVGSFKSNKTRIRCSLHGGSGGIQKRLRSGCRRAKKNYVGKRLYRVAQRTAAKIFLQKLHISRKNEN